MDFNKLVGEEVEEWVVDVGIPMGSGAGSNLYIFNDLRDNYDPISTGGGFGYYDCQFAAEGKQHAIEMAMDIAQRIKEERLHIIINPKEMDSVPSDVAYISYYACDHGDY